MSVSDSHRFAVSN